MKVKTLVMDDDPFVLEIAKQMLDYLGHEVLLAKDGEEAIKIFKEHRKSGVAIDLIIMDLTIPSGMGGKEAVREILTLDPEAKVIVSSGYSNDSVMADSHEYGFKGAIKKPFLVADLNKIITEVMGS